MSIRAWLGAIALTGMFGCAGTASYVYQPESSNAIAAGLPAARTAIPQEAPQGAIEVVSYGVTDLSRADAKIPVLPIRAIITNDGDDQPWTLDTSAQMVEIPGEGRSRAMYVNADVGTLPQVTIARHERRVLDFYFPLPDTIRGASGLPHFEMLWQVTTPARVVASRTPFDRVDREPATEVVVAPAAWPLWAGYGPYWWYDPFYPRTVFVHARPWHVHRGPVMIGHFGGRFHAGGAHVAHRGR